VTKVFLDSNILISSICSTDARSNPNKIFKLREDKIIEIYVSTKVTEECRENVKSRFPSFQEECEELLYNCKFLNDCISPYNNIEIMGLPSIDKLIVNTAIFNGMDFFITGNKNDFINLYGNKYDKTIIMSLKDFLSEFNIS